MRLIAVLLSLTLFAGNVSGAEVQKFVVENKIKVTPTTTQKFVVENKTTPAASGGTAKKSSFVKGATTQTTVVQTAGTKVPPVVVRGSSEAAPAAEGTTTNAPLIGLYGGTTTSNCPNGQCPAQQSSIRIFRRR